MEQLLQRKASYFEICTFLHRECLPVKQTLKLVLQYEHLQAELIAFHYERGMSLEKLAKYGVDIAPFQVREYSKIKARLRSQLQINEDLVSDNLISDGFRTETVTYFVLEDLLASNDTIRLDVILSYLDSVEDIQKMLPLIALMPDLPDCLVMYLKKHGIDTSSFALSEEQKAFPERKVVPTNDDVITSYQMEQYTQLYSPAELTTSKQATLYVLIDHFARNDPDKIPIIMEDMWSVSDKLMTDCLNNFVDIHCESIAQGQYLPLIQQFIFRGADNTLIRERFANTPNIELQKILYPPQSKDNCIIV